MWSTSHADASSGRGIVRCTVRGHGDPFGPFVTLICFPHLSIHFAIYRVVRAFMRVYKGRYGDSMATSGLMFFIAPPPPPPAPAPDPASPPVKDYRIKYINPVSCCPTCSVENALLVGHSKLYLPSSLNAPNSSQPSNQPTKVCVRTTGTCRHVWKEG